MADIVILFFLLLLVWIFGNEIESWGTSTGSKNTHSTTSNYWHRRTLRIDEILESWKTCAAFATVTLKSAILLNGASSVALLTFIAYSGVDGGKNLIPALRHFLWGTFLPVIATALAYFSAYAENRALWSWVETEHYPKHLQVAYSICQLGAIVLVGLSYVLFYLGVTSGTNVLTAVSSSS